jgi:hypothetical protein
MPLAAPLILPFAELAGITIAGLGMAAASEKVSDFISDNPEISMEILTTLIPGGIGLNTLFKDKDAPSTKDIVLGELGKEKGNYSDPDAEGAYSSKRGRIIKALEKAGKIKKGPDKDYDPSKKYKDYKKFYEKANGGAIGIEVLFEEKKNGGRIGFANGGENIIGKSLDNITNVAKGLDKEMLDMTYSDKYYKDVIQPAKLGKGPMPSRMEMIGQNLKNFGPFKAMGIGMRPDIYGERAQPTKAASKFLSTLGSAAKFGLNRVAPVLGIFSSTPANASEVDMTIEDFQALQDKTYPTSTPGVMVDANEGFRTPTRTNVQGRDLEADLGTRINPNIQPQQNIFQRAGDVFSSIKDNIPNFGIMGLLSSLDRFDTLPIEDQQFILDQAGGNRPSKDRYGKNIRSAFGNYAQYVRDKGIFAPGKRGEYYRSISGLDQALMDTLDREQKAKAVYEKQIRDAANEAARNAARARSITAGYGGSDDSRGATGPTASGAGMGVGGGYASDYFGAYGGSVPTGLATMFVEKR